MARILGRRLAGLLAALLCCAAALAAGPAAPAGAVSATAGLAGRAGTGVTSAGQPAAGPGANLLLNPGAQAGAASAEGWDAVTIPGWEVASGLPTVVPYGAPNLAPATGQWPAVHGGRLFAGGAGGTARLTQVVSLRQPAGQPVPAGTWYRLSGWLGGTAKSRATMTVAFLSAAGGVLARRAIGHGGGSDRLARRAATGALPRGTASARVTLTLSTSLTNDDGPNAPLVGYDRAVADGVAFSVSVAVRRPPLLTPPPVHVPRYQHVFLFYFENEDYGSVLGNTKQASFLNSLVPRSSVLANFFAEEHPSDANYLALAGGSAFGVPLDDPLEENSQYTIHARNIGDLIGARHETWKAYLQSANGPCDDTVHKNYWDDDEPMTYFADVRLQPTYCAARLVPLAALRTDLASAATTPNFAWVAPDDCSDMEGCGIKAGDQFLATQLGAIMRSPAWRTQRSLAIITFDEDGYDYEHPAQRVLTLMLGSGVRQGYVSHVRYTHYSLLRTIEGALGLGALTRNDLYARPVNDVFEPGTAAAVAPRPAGRAAAQPGTRPMPSLASEPSVAAAGAEPARAGVGPAAAAGAQQQTAFVVNSASGTVTPISLATRRAGKPIKVGASPDAIAIARGSATAYVTNYGSNTVTPIDTATRQAGAPIAVGVNPDAIAITPDGRTAYVANYGSNTVTPINTVTGQPGAPIAVGEKPRAIAIMPNGKTAYALNWGGTTVTPIATATNRAGRPIPVGSYPFAIAIAPDGRTAYVASYGANTLTPINVATGRPGRPIPAGQAPDSVAVTPNGKKVLVVGGDSDTVTTITTAGGRAAHAAPVGYAPAAVSVSPSGGTAYVVNTISGTLTPVSTSTGQAGPPIKVGIYTYPTAISLAPSGGIAVVVGTYAGRATLVDTSTGKVIARITVGTYPVAAAITTG